jgi:hypothetical protein
VLVSAIMIAQILNNRWSELLTPNFQVTKDLAGPGARSFLQSEQSCTESPALACHA